MFASDFDGPQVNPGEKTEWDLVLERMGIRGNADQSQDKEQKDSWNVRIEDDDPDAKDADQANADTRNKDLDDDYFFEQYRKQRLAELRQTGHFGRAIHISKQDYVREVNNAGKGVWVVLHLYQESLELSQKVNAKLSILAEKFSETKFLLIRSTDCIPNYPDRCLPTILIYHEDDLKKQITGINALGGEDFTTDDLEWVLAQTGAVKTEMKANPIEVRCLQQLDKVFSGQYKNHPTPNQPQPPDVD